MYGEKTETHRKQHTKKQNIKSNGFYIIYNNFVIFNDNLCWPNHVTCTQKETLQLSLDTYIYLASL